MRKSIHSTRWEGKSKMKGIKFSSNHILLCVSFLLMLLSFLVSFPTGEMIVAIEWNGIAMAFVMTMTVAGLRKENVMGGLEKSAQAFTHTGSLAAFFAAMALILSPFITSLFALSSILPLAIKVLRKREREELVPSFAAIITLSATGGGTLLPGGSWQNIVLHKTLGDESFITAMLPYFIASIPVAALAVFALLGKRTMERTYITEEIEQEKGNKGLKMLYVCFAFIALLASLSLFRWVDIVLFTAVILLVFDRSVYLKADYSFLLSTIFLLIAGSCASPVLSLFTESGALWKCAVLSEIIGSYPVAALFGKSAADPVTLLKAVNIGTAGTVLSLPALAAMSILKKEERKAFAIRYTIVSLILLAAFVILAVIFS